MQFLSLIETTFTWCLNGLKWLFGMAAHTTQMPRWVYYLLHYGVVFLITILLAAFNDRVLSLFGDGVSLPDIPFVNQYWAGFLFLLTYLFIRLLIYFIALFWQEDEAEFADIDIAWAAGERGLADAGIDLRKVPLFLINGLDEVHEPNFFRTAGFTEKVVAPAKDERCPLRFYANQDVLFIACSDVSAISSQVRAPQVAAVSLGGGEGPANQPMSTLKPEDIRQAAAGVAQTLEPGQLKQQLAGTLSPGAIANETVRASRSLQSIDHVTCERRVRYLCKLITRARAPVCPINGLLVTVPLEWTRPAADQNLYETIEQDVQVLHDSLRMLFPVVCVMTGLYQLGSLKEFIERANQTDSRFGSHLRAGAHFPPGHPVDEPSAKWNVDKGLEWFRSWIYKAFAHDLSSQSNPQLYRLLCNLEDRRSGMVRMLQAAFGRKVHHERVRLTGCYYAEIELRSRQQAFVRGVLEKLVGDQDLLAYSAAYVRQDQQCRQWGYVCCVGIAVLAIADVCMMVMLWRS